MIIYQPLSRGQLPLIWTIDRSEFIERIYVLRDGELVLHGWSSGQPQAYAPQFEVAFDDGAWFLGAWDDGTLAGVAVLGARPIETQAGALQLVFLHVSQPYRGVGVGAELFERTRAEARSRGATAMYISATESEHTVNFYLARGCRLNPSPDPSLFELEPKDIHLLVDTIPVQRLP